MKWRLIEQETFNAPMNMAYDHAIYESVASGKELPTIRFYKWKNNSISLGAYQTPNEINIDFCRKNSIEVVRRMTGGRAVYHDKVDFTYSVIAPIKVFSYSIEKAYKDVCYFLIDALTEMGIDASLENKNDVMVSGKKISGNAAKAMEKGVYLQHGTLIYDIDYDLMPAALNIERDLVRKRAISILSKKKVSQEKVYDSLKNSFTFGKGISALDFSEYEKQRAKDLANSAYSTILLPKGSFMKNKGACYVERGGIDP